MRMKQMALAGALAALAAGCTAGYDDGYYRDGYRSDAYYRDHHWRDRHDRDGWGDRDRDSRKVRVCDADGSDCHWEWRER